MTWLVVGLGNPGPTYAGNRHNIGFMAVDELARRSGDTLARHKRALALVAESRVGIPGTSVRTVLAEPQSFMNDSGGPVKALMDFYDIEADHLVVLHDELDIPLATLRLKFGGGDNGHNGLKSIRKSIGTGEFFRVRMGIGRPPGRQDPADFVLRDFAGAEREEAGVMVGRAADAVEALVLHGLETAQQRFND